MRIKPGVILQGLKIEMRPALLAANKIWKAYGKELVITSALDGTHSPGSLHYYGYALDFRTHYFHDGIPDLVAKTLRKELGRNYDVVLHDTHIHVEYDPKEGKQQ